MLIPEYYPVKEVLLSLHGSDDLYVEYLAILASHLKNQDTRVRVIFPDETYCDTGGHARASIYSLNQRMQYYCKSEFGLCDPPQLEYMCSRHNYPWIQNDAMLEGIDEATHEKVYFVSRGAAPLRAQVDPSLQPKITKLPLIWSGNASFKVDALGGNLYVTDQLVDLNPTFGKSGVEIELRKYFKFKSLVWLKANPWESTKDLDTVVHFASTKDGVVHAFLATNGEKRRSLKPDRYLRNLDIYGPALGSRDEEVACGKHIFDGHFLGCSSFALNSVGELQGYWNDQEEFARKRRICEQETQFNECMRSFSENRNRIAREADHDNLSLLVRAGIDERNIHTVPNAGIYTGTGRTTSAASYINGIAQGNTYYLPKFPSFEIADRYYDETKASSREKMLQWGASDVAAMDAFSIVYAKTVPIRIDFMRGGAIHCTTYVVNKPLR